MIFRNTSRRLTRYDYRNPGAYFVTVKTNGNRDLFGYIHEGIIFLNGRGRVVLDEWKRITNVRDNVRCAEFVIMPDHIHGVIEILPYRLIQPLEPDFRLLGGSLGAIMGQFKSRVTKRIRNESGNPHFTVWQTNYYDHIIRSSNDRERVRRYIQQNPMRFHP